MKKMYTFFVASVVSVSSIAQQATRPSFFTELEKLQTCHQRSLYQPKFKTTGTGSRVKSYLQKTYDGTVFADSDSALINYSGNHSGDLLKPPLKYDDYVLVSMNAGSWVNYYKSMQTFDAQENIATETSQIWNNVTNAWENSYKNTYTYDANNNIATQLTQTWSGGVWENDSKTSHTYTSNNLTQSVTETWDNITSSWKPYNRHIYQYNASNQQTMDISQAWNSVTSSWVNVWRDASNYNSAGDNDEIISQMWDGVSSWDNYSKQVLTYNSNHLPTQAVQMNWDAVTSAYVNTRQNNYSYNSDDMVVSLDSKTWNAGGFWEYVGGDAQYDIRYETYLGLNDVTRQGNLNLYPVPATDHFTLQLDWNSNRPYVMSICDVQGREIQRWSESGSHQLSKTIDVSTLAPGSYFLKAANEEGRVIQKFTIVR